MDTHHDTVPTRHRTTDWEYKCLAFHGKIRTFATQNKMNMDASTWERRPYTPLFLIDHVQTGIYQAL